jgi:hypothetical protein
MLWMQDRYAGELLRLCTSPAAPRNAESKLYARVRRIWQLMGGTKMHTYTLQTESGATMRAVGHKAPAAKVKGQQWDRPSRPRAEKAIHDQDKLRWSETLPEVKS